MIGTARKMIDRLLSEKAKGDRVIENGICVKLMLKGIPIDKLTVNTPDDDAIINKVKSVLTEFGVSAS
ncbi:MAG: hypothetical protein LBI42_05930 [Chitinispirillales bacterium]|jgi:hypothetical protein|nr:hypothetical protein [Chitinispirillales bacterium]